MYAVFRRGLRHLIRSFHIVLDGLVGALLHEGHMLVGRRVEDDVRSVLFDDRVDPLRVPHRADKGHQMEVVIFSPQLLLDLVGIIFVYIEDDQRLRSGRGDLPAQLAPDGAASSGDHDHLILEHFHDLTVVDLDLGSPEEVCDLHIPQLGDADFLVQDLVYTGHCLHPAACVLADVQDGFPVGSRGGRDRVHDTRDLVFFYFLHDIVAVAHDGDPFQHPSPLIWVVVNDAAYLCVQVAAVHHLPDDSLAGLAAADDHDPVRRLRLLPSRTLLRPGEE